MAGDSIFGTDPKRLKKLAALGLEGPEGPNDRGPASTRSGDPFVERPGDWVGPYKLLTVLGEGGMGIVYLAEQQRPIRRQVALKLVKPGMDSKRVIARFEAEQQALALMDHPYVAQVHDAGLTASGRPYFVMEYVEGISITEYCDRHQLTIEERLRLFLHVCEGIQHAHSKGIIHRDIKPSNVLVGRSTDDAVPKIIDFGIAKALSQPLTERTLCTEQGRFVGTPEYMSPEQAELTTQGVDIRTDVYSLGVVLYELLAGVLPFDPEALREGGAEHIRQVIREEDPKTPSTRLSTVSGEQSARLALLRRTDIRTLRRKLHGDLDWITLKAMEKDPSRRYETAHAFAEDVRRHLNHEPVFAGVPGIGYRLGKFVRRNRVRVIVVGGAAVLLVCFGALMLAYSRTSRQARVVAVLRDQDTLQTAQNAFSERRFTEALDLIGPLVGSKHVGGHARLLQANILLEGGHPQRAEEELASLIQDEPEVAGAAHALLARIYWENSDSQIGSLEQAAFHRKEAERLLPETADAFYLGALTALTVKDTMQMLEKALTLDPRHYPSRRLHACTLWASQRYSEMESDALALIVSRPKDSFGYFLGATARFEQAKYEEALKNIEQALAFATLEAQRRIELLDLQCRTHLALGQYPRVVSDTETCLQQFPDKTVFSFHQFCAHLGLGQYDQARAVFQRIADANDQAEQVLIDWSYKYVFDALAAGRDWHMPGQRPQGAPFVHMNEAETDYKDYAEKGRRIISKGFPGDWSPDGTKLAYSSGALGASGIALYDFRTGQSELLIVPGTSPCWSPDGRYIAFVRDRQVLDMAVLASVRRARVGSTLGRRQEVWVMRSDGTEARRLAFGTRPSWSPDGNDVFYYSSVMNALCRIAAHDRAAQPHQVWETTNPWASVSPDGRQVAMIYSDTRLCIFDLEDSASRPVHICDFPDLRLYGGKWAPSGRWFSLGGYDPALRDGLWIYDINQRQAKKILGGRANTAHLSPDGRSLVYSAPLLEIWRADLESLGPGKTFAAHDREMAAHYTRMIHAYPEETRYYLSRANCYSRLNELEEAVADIETVDRLSAQTETRARWLAALKAAHKAGTSMPPGPLPGSTSYSRTTGLYTVVGAGLDIWDNADECHFAYARLAGDGSITARVDSVEYVHPWTKAGVMIRNTLDPVSPQGIVFISPNGRVSFQWRDREKGITRGVGSEANTVNPPHWVRFLRKGNRFTPQHSVDGTRWEAFSDLQDPNVPASVEIQMNETVYLGLAVTSHNTTRAAEARISNVAVTGSVSPPGPFIGSQDIVLQALSPSHHMVR